MPLFLVGYGIGIYFLALFAQIRGGIYTKTIDVGLDLVGKVERGIPEDDKKNHVVSTNLVNLHFIN
jgi:K(+)-stimulated pyrophosphate-energized sodium pump